jgi:hypothetical protein
MQFSYTALALATLGLQCAVAQPAHQRHHHRHRRAKPDAAVPEYEYNLDFSNEDLYKSVDWSSVFSTPQATDSPVASPPESFTPAVTSPAPATPAKKPDDKQDSEKGSKPKGPHKNFGGRTEPIDTRDHDGYIGNVGIPYGSNMLLVDESERDDYKYTITLTNVDETPNTYIVWNKSGRDGRPQSGMGDEPNLRFTLGGKESQVIAFDENSQVAFSRDCQRNKLQGNLPDCTWGEADFGDLRNGAWSGYDCSSIPNTRGNVDYCKIECEGAKTSSHLFNSFTSAAQTNAGGALAPGPAAFYAEL